jgi:hypothetical protein
MSDSANPRFLKGGWRRAIRGAAAQIKEARQRITAEVALEYQEQLAGAGRFRRFWLGWRKSREINARLAEQIEEFAPRDALYAR